MLKKCALLLASIVFFVSTADAKMNIVSRSQWGADESLRFRTVEETTVVQEAAKLSVRERRQQQLQRLSSLTPQQEECQDLQKKYPADFAVSRVLKSDARNGTYRWALEYAKPQFFVIHHTAGEVGDDDRSSAERMRAIYTYHANSRGWGDIGYNYVIDENGIVYEGRAGQDKANPGETVVAGHAYCYNRGSIGIALMGHFSNELPSQSQMQSLQQLIYDLADQYDIDLNRKITFHGKTMDPVVGHEDVSSTTCPGHYLSETMTQIRRNIRTNNVAAAIVFPDPPRNESVVPVSVRTSSPNSPFERRRRIAQRMRFQGKDIQIPSRTSTTVASAQTSSSDAIRVRLGYDKSTAALSVSSSPLINGVASDDAIRLQKRGSSCIATNGLTVVGNGVVRIDPGTGITTIASWDRGYNQFRGVIECRVIDGELTLINELPLEEYLAGLSEEPDTEPWEKQRAFAIAARSYAAHYMQESFRKFPGKPYDGDDSPARFQKYSGYAYELQHPSWVRAVADTAHTVLMKDGDILKAPYFSSSDGRTRTPAEAGWSTFYHSEVFQSVPDPWCAGEQLRGHGVGMSGCGAEAQANEGKTAEQILQYYYTGVVLGKQ